MPWQLPGYVFPLFAFHPMILRYCRAESKRATVIEKQKLYQLQKKKPPEM
jgi:hypothetical protein